MKENLPRGFLFDLVGEGGGGFGSKKTGKLSIVFEDLSKKFGPFSNRSEALYFIDIDMCCRRWFISVLGCVCVGGVLFITSFRLKENLPEFFVRLKHA